MHLKPPAFKGAQYKRWRTRAVYWFQTMGCYDAIKGKPEGDLNPAQLEAFEKIDTLFKCALLSVLDDSIVDSYMSFDNGKDMCGLRSRPSLVPRTPVASCTSWSNSMTTR